MVESQQTVGFVQLVAMAEVLLWTAENQTNYNGQITLQVCTNACIHLLLNCKFKTIRVQVRTSI